MLAEVHGSLFVHQAKAISVIISRKTRVNTCEHLLLTKAVILCHKLEMPSFLGEISVFALLMGHSSLIQSYSSPPTTFLEDF